ncbi:MAG: translation initiation factor [Synechococcus sp. SB0668_bin_15]|nr:translation initiation factor [Synechococcus sp. SB0668_bin_15]MXZ83675.1 translation initiation factor [Synechococcus sp. SB0666_bin_14]MYA91221.1 translation initiation factor [Synechococcus sp. SB0663_bin_10]MYC50228.1 translation initiation factor [Synechococcus sp. SB0662_bin_14]MYG45833.1 translation initiation factor [Synechococcus sp. SB0675_bin_6]MYJ59719.1 translation initiation factor [Synechococcus sp. SB0672_bin_6]MYK91975.1 translation initiation factor [Synechococcus sp. SB0
MARNRGWQEFTADQTPRIRSQPPAPQHVRVQRSSRGRGGKTVTIVTGLELPPDQLRALTKALKVATGTGGGVQGDTLVLQGDRVTAVLEQLAKHGYQAKRSGG